MRWITLVTIFALQAILLRADPVTATFNASNDNVQTAFLFSTNATYNQTDQFLGAGTVSEEPFDSLLRFDLSSLAGQYSAIDSITLTLYTSQSYGVGELGLYAVSASDDGWGTSSATFPTWNYQNENTSIAWAGSPGLQTSGVDYNSTALASGEYSNTVPAYVIGFSGNSATLTSLVNSWNSGQNGGLLIDSLSTNNNTYVEFYGGANSTSNDSLLPELTVTYDPVDVPEPDAFLLLGVTSLVVVAAYKCRPAKRG